MELVRKVLKIATSLYKMSRKGHVGKQKRQSKVTWYVITGLSTRKLSDVKNCVSSVHIKSTWVVLMNRRKDSLQQKYFSKMIQEHCEHQACLDKRAESKMFQTWYCIRFYCQKNIENKVILSLILKLFPGPLNCSVEDIEKLLKAGMTMVLLPMWLFNQEEKIQAVRNIREAVNIFSTKYDRVIPLGVGVDLRGPLIHTGRLVEVSSVLVKINNLIEPIIIAGSSLKCFHFQLIALHFCVGIWIYM